MFEEIIRALWALIKDPVFAVSVIVAVICGITLKLNGKDLPKTAKGALIAAIFLFSAIALLLAVLVIAGAMTLVD
jgi:hypothetical protein